MNCCRQTSLDWQLQGGMSRRVAGPGMNFSSRISSVGLAESDGGVPTYHSPLSQTYTAVDFEMQASISLLVLVFSILYDCGTVSEEGADSGSEGPRRG